jgi:hypothetical protein
MNEKSEEMTAEGLQSMHAMLAQYVPTDSFFGPPYIDIDEHRDAPVPHRYIHGGFSDTATRFSFYFPPRYEGRFFQFLEGGYGGDENSVVSRGGMFGGVGYAASRGGFFVESNQGHIGAERCPKAGDDATVYGYRASAECARLARHLAGSVYGEKPKHGYLFGGSGGGHRTLLAMEYVEDVGVWDGGVASVIAAPDTFRAYSAMNNARRVVGDHFDQVVDAIEPGGSGNPFEHLDSEQREELAHLYAEGFARGSERSVQEGLNAGVMFWAWNADLLRQADRGYFEAFWTEPGHAGADGVVDDWTIDLKSTVAETLTPHEAAEYPLSGFGRMLLTAPADKLVGIRLVDEVPRSVEGARITILSGAAAGRLLYCTNFARGLIIGASIGEAQTLLFDGVEPGDEVHVDNQDFLAYCYYYRHHIPEPSRAPRLFMDGHPIYPQHRAPDVVSSPVFGTVPRHDLIRRPTFVLQHTLDTSGWPPGGVEFEDHVRAHLGERTESQFRLWWIDNAEHISGSVIPVRSLPAPSTRLVDYTGAHESALDAMVAWIERDVTPPVSTNYRFERDVNCVRLAAGAVERGGIQPVVTATANGSVRAEVQAGEEVSLVMHAEVPAGAGSIVEVAWDYEGAGTWPEVHAQRSAQSSLRHETCHVFSEPGTYFPAARVLAHAQGDTEDPYARVMNLGRCRVVVH